jgi:predicted phosphodiesterase
MRVAVISDVHGNLPALECALQAVRRAGADQLLCLGDLVGYGPYPNECVARVAELDALVVAGNHDLMVVDRIEQRASPLASRLVDWTRSVLDADARAYLAALPLQRSVDSEIVMTHGGLGDPCRYVWPGAGAAAELRALERFAPRAGVLLVGHTHEALAYGERSRTQLAGGQGRVSLPRSERFLLNPGAVGQSRQWSGAARLVVLDLERRTARFTAVPYDAAPVREELLRLGLPPGTCHRRPPPSSALRRLGRGLLLRGSAPLRRRKSTRAGAGA